MAAKMKSVKPDAVKLIPGAQVIITGKPISQEQATEVINFIKNFCISTWCHPDGQIGYIDSVKPTSTFNLMCQEFHSVAQNFPYLELGITFMNGAPGSYNQPMASYIVAEGRIKRDMSMTSHFGHPAPRRNPAS